MRGPNYDWKAEAEHERAEKEKLRNLLQFKDDKYAALESEVSRLNEKLEKSIYEKEWQKGAYMALKCRLAKAKKALEFYAEDFRSHHDEPRGELGCIARACLAELKGEG